MTYALSPLVNAVIIVLVLLPASSLSNAHEARVFLVGRRFPLTVSGARKKAHGRQQWAPMLPMIMSRGGKAESCDGLIPEKQKQVSGSFLSRSWKAYENHLEHSPLITKAITSGIICGASDITCQFLEGGSSGLLRTSRSIRRLAGFGFIGFFYVTPMVHYWVEILEWLSRRPFAQQWILNGPGGKGEKPQGVRRALLQIFVDQLIGSAVINMGFIIVHSLICGSSIQAAVRKAINDIASVMAASVKLWAPAGFVNFLFVPRHLRVAECFTSLDGKWISYLLAQTRTQRGFEDNLYVRNNSPTRACKKIVLIHNWESLFHEPSVVDHSNNVNALQSKIQ